MAITSDQLRPANSRQRHKLSCASLPIVVGHDPRQTPSLILRRTFSLAARYVPLRGMNSCVLKQLIAAAHFTVYTCTLKYAHTQVTARYFCTH